MNTLKAITILLALCITGCEPAKTDQRVTKESNKITIDGTNAITYRTVVLDGNEYYAVATSHGHWTLCPKLPPKIK